MNVETQFSRSPGFVTVDMLTEKLDDKKSNSINKIHYAHTVQEGDVVNHMPYNSGIYFRNLANNEMLPSVFKDDIATCKIYK